MTINTTVKKIMGWSGVTQERFAKMLGLASSAGVRKRINTPGMTTNNALEMLDLLGYEMVVRPKQAGRNRPDEILITFEDEV